MAAAHGKAETMNFEKVDVLDALDEMTGGRGPDACIDAVGLEAHGTSARCVVRPRQDSDVAWRPTARMRCARRSLACRKGGTVSIPGVYGGLLDKFPMGAAFAKGLTFKMGQTHVHKYMKPLLEPHRTRRDRPVLRDHRSLQALRRGRRLQTLLDATGRLREGRAQTVRATDRTQRPRSRPPSQPRSRSFNGSNHSLPVALRSPDSGASDGSSRGSSIGFRP